MEPFIPAAEADLMQVQENYEAKLQEQGRFTCCCKCSPTCSFFYYFN
jgi:hypothetical protein